MQASRSQVLVIPNIFTDSYTDTEDICLLYIPKTRFTEETAASNTTSPMDIELSEWVI